MRVNRMAELKSFNSSQENNKKEIQLSISLTDPENTPHSLTHSTPTGRDWKAADLRQKSWDDLHKLWFVLLMERNRLNSEKVAYKAKSQAMPDPYRITKVKKSMNRIKQVMSERVREHDDPQVQQQLKDFINAL